MYCVAWKYLVKINQMGRERLTAVTKQSQVYTVSTYVHTCLYAVHLHYISIISF